MTEKELINSDIFAPKRKLYKHYRPLTETEKKIVDAFLERIDRVIYGKKEKQ